MSINESNGKRIAKNTLFLYFRMIVIMLVTIYTSRVILHKLGADDYGLYNVVAGVVGMLAFLNNTLSLGTSRFLTFKLGTKDEDGLKETFNTAFYTHLLLAFLVIIVLESFGLWFLNHKLVIPPERFFACRIIFQFSILTTLISITQVPYTSLIIAHEQMNVYAYFSIIEAALKLSIVFVLPLVKVDRLIFYGLLVAIVQLIVALIYRIYCKRHYYESRLRKIFKKSIFKDMMGYSGWNIIANLSDTINHAGLPIILNLFFQPVVVAAQSISNQVTNALMQFVSSFRTAINPQIIKKYAAGDFEGSKNLTLTTTVYVFDLLLLLCLPCIAIMNPLMDLWLVDVPEYAVLFTQYAVAKAIIGCFSSSFYIPMMAAGKLKTNSVAALFVSVLQYSLLYMLFKLGLGVMWVQYIAIFATSLFSFVIKPIILNKEIGYKWSELLTCYKNCFRNAVLPISITVACMLLLPVDNIIQALLVVFIIGISVIISSFIFLDAKAKMVVMNKLRRTNI